MDRRGGNKYEQVFVEQRAKRHGFHMSMLASAFEKRGALSGQEFRPISLTLPASQINPAKLIFLIIRKYLIKEGTMTKNVAQIDRMRASCWACLLLAFS